MTIQLFDLVAEYIDNLLLYALSIKKDLDKEHSYFLSGARNHFFKLEAACRYLREIDHEKVFDEYYDIFKEAEDQLGQYDHHFALLSEIRKIGKQWPAKVIDHFEDQHKSSAKKLENYLEKEEWMQQNPPHLIRFIEKLKQMESISGEDFKERTGKFLIKTIDKISDNYKNGKLDASEIEEGVHEIRRKIRWLSIYTQVCGGMIQLSSEKIPDSFPSQYIGKDILNSDFMKMPKALKDVSPITIRTELFAALSWMINYLGSQKDIGLKIVACTEAFKETGIDDPQEIEKLLIHINPEQLKLNDITDQAKTALDLFFLKHKILDGLADDIKQSIK
ncbi:MAG: hypothetical protein IPN36_12145 [Bacteroidetes bacterium]|nr:hypothetical protein [Bacteroidota bacterium]